MVGGIVILLLLLLFFLFFSFPFFFFFDEEPKKALTKSINLNFIAKLKAEKQRVDLKLKTSGTTFDRGFYQHTYYVSINMKT